jgi:para-aminobenzoate synthetase/4-amino-4-deoxychorismate lyase
MFRAVFGSAAENSHPLILNSPTRVLYANQLPEILPLLKSAEAAAASGSWVALMLSYEAAPAFDRALKTHRPGLLPLAMGAVFDGPTTEPSEVVGPTGGYKLSSWTPQVTRTQYNQGIEAIRELIARGDTYQVNYTFPMTSSFPGDSVRWYENLCRAQGAEYSVYLDLGRYKILSLSPEMFFERKGDAIKTRPMKGTIKRGRWTAEDDELAKQLAASEKDRAENVMIVDLLRNDLGKVSIPGSVRVSKLFEVERFETLWQMTSTVESTARTGVGLSELLAALFPCGSITGAPKVRTMEIIHELEPQPRGIYTGTIGFMAPGGECKFNVAIRTVVLDSETGIATFGVGGGVTIDSTAEREYDECLLKGSFLNASGLPFRLLESILLEDGELFLMRSHIERLKSSARYFGFHFSEEQIIAELNRLTATKSAAKWKIRLLLSREGKVTSETVPVMTRHEPLRVALATEPVDSTDRFLYHKTTSRGVYDRALAARPDCDDVILWNERGEITESTVANVVVGIGGEFFTPPQASGLLAGTFREQLIEEGKLRERVVRIDEFKRASNFFLINSVQKWISAVLVD